MQKIPAVVPVDTPSDFDLVVKSAQASIIALKKLDYDALYDEMAHLNVPAVGSASVHVLADQIGKVQALKDRMSEILVDVEREFRVKKRCADILSEGWQKFASGSAVDKKADATLRLSEFKDAAGDAECLYKTAMRIMTNLDDKQSSLSRQVTIYQILQRMGDAFRGLPDPDHTPVGNGGARSNDDDLRDWDNQPE
jgi:hypothetical protein